MKQFFSLFGLLLCLLVASSSCVESNESAYPLKRDFHFTADAHSKEVKLYSTKTDKLLTKHANWEFTFLFRIIKDEEGRERTVLMDGVREEQLADGSYRVDGGWVKFYYPKTRHFIRVEVQPNPTSEPRCVYFSAGWIEKSLDLTICQEGKLQP